MPAIALPKNSSDFKAILRSADEFCERKFGFRQPATGGRRTARPHALGVD